MASSSPPASPRDEAPLRVSCDEPRDDDDDDDDESVARADPCDPICSSPQCMSSPLRRARPDQHERDESSRLAGETDEIDLDATDLDAVAAGLLDVIRLQRPPRRTPRQHLRDATRSFFPSRTVKMHCF